MGDRELLAETLDVLASSPLVGEGQSQKGFEMAKRKTRETGLSKPAATVYAHMRLTPEEKAKLEQLAAECNVTLSFAFREGTRLYLEDLKQMLAEQKQRGLIPRDPGGKVVEG